MTHKQQLIEKYLTFFEKNDLDGVLSFFTHDATVEGTVYKNHHVKDFHKDFFKDTHSSKTTLRSLTFLDKDTVNVDFDYLWTLKEGQKITFTVKTIFHFTPTDKIKKITIHSDIVSIS